MAYSADTFVADEQPTTAKWNKLWTNDASFNDGTGILADAILATHRSQVAKVGNFQITATGSKSITGVGFKPRSVQFFVLPAGARAVMGMGASDGTNQWAVSSVATSTPNTDTAYVTNKCLQITNTSSAVYIDAAITSMDTDGFTINVTTYAATYGNNFGYIAHA